MRERPIGKGCRRRVETDEIIAEHRAMPVAADLPGVLLDGAAPSEPASEQRGADGVDEAGLRDGKNVGRNVLIAKAGGKGGERPGLVAHQVCLRGLFDGRQFWRTCERIMS